MKSASGFEEKTELKFVDYDHRINQSTVIDTAIDAVIDRGGIKSREALWVVCLNPPNCRLSLNALGNCPLIR